MKKTFFILSTLLCLTFSAVYLCHLRRESRQKMTQLKTVATETFIEALKLEIGKRENISIPIYTSKHERRLREKVPDSITIESQHGKRTYMIPKDKYENRLFDNYGEKERLLSILLENHPIAVDTLNALWDSLLLQRHIAMHTRIRYTAVDLLEDTTVTYSKSVETTPKMKMLCSRYMGSRYEFGATGYVYVDHIFAEILTHKGGILLLPWLLLCILGYTWNRWTSYIRNKLGRREIIIQNKEVIVEKTIEKIVERPVRVIDENASTATLFQLDENVFFDSIKMVIIKDGMEFKLRPQTGVLLKMFFEAKEHQLTREELEQNLWGNKHGYNKLNSAIHRLREVLATYSCLQLYTRGDSFKLSKKNMETNKDTNPSIKE